MACPTWRSYLKLRTKERGQQCPSNEMQMYTDDTLNEIQGILVERHKEPELFKGDWKKLPLLQETIEAWAWEIEGSYHPVLELKASETRSGQTEAFELNTFVWKISDE